jgi:NAD(P)-dependent dehydrogenase (short-subunit alcohol dehydrogenase family)
VDDVLGYAGRRVVVTGASSAIGAATVRLLVDLGAEVHAIGADRPAVEGLASFTETAPDTASIDAALHKVGAVLNGVFVCDADASLAAHAVWRAAPLTVAGSAIVALTDRDDEHALPAIDAPAGVRGNAVSAGAGVAPDDVAWLLAAANSPRAAALDRTVLPARPQPGGSRVDTGWL